MAMKLLTPEGELGVRRELIELGSCREKDPAWRFTDKHRHDHKWHIPQGANDWRKQDYWRLPTLRRVEFNVYYPDGDIGRGVHYYCKRCGELIRPGYRTSPFPRFIAGPTEYYLDGVMIDKTRAETILAKLKEERILK